VKSEQPNLRVGTADTEIEILSDPYVVYTFRGYAPVVDVRVVRSGMPFVMFVSARSLASELEEMREAKGSLVGLRCRIRKESSDQFARYILSEVDSDVT
jgi:hypothetical protein